MSFIFLCLLVFCTAFIVLYSIIIISNKFHIFIDSNRSNKPQRFHYHPTPRAGGIGIVFSVIIGFCWLGLYTWDWLYFILGGLVIFGSGFLEDMGVSLSPKLRLLIQCIGALIGCIGMEHALLRDLGFGLELAYVFSIIFSIFAIVGVCNAMNIIDGFNGLSGGIALCVCVSIIIVATQVDMSAIVKVTVIFMSAILGFLALNFPNGKIFLGDGGAYFLGFSLAMILVLLTQKPSSIVSAWYGFCVMVYPVWEVLFSILRRKIFDKTEAMQPDSAHFHILLFKKLRNNPLSAFIIVCANLPFIALATLFYANTFALVITCLVFIIAYTIIYRLLARN